MASMRDIKRRRQTIRNTAQITKAVKLVATVRLQKAKELAEQTAPYTQALYRTVQSILGKTNLPDNIYLRQNTKGKKAVAVITSNRGLAGGYNQNIVRAILENPEFSPRNTQIYAIGLKGRDSLAGRSFEIAASMDEAIDAPSPAYGANLASQILEAYKRQEVGAVYLTYTAFKNMLTFVPQTIQLLPLTPDQGRLMQNASVYPPMGYEPSEEEVLNWLVPRYLEHMFFGALLSASASEHAARMTAMDSAVSNAQDMLETLEIQYNRARQGAITQELTEIVAGAGALS